MSGNSESGLNVTGELSSANILRQIQDVLNSTLSEVEKQECVRKLLGSQVTSDSHTVPQESATMADIGNELAQESVQTGRQYNNRRYRDRRYREDNDYRRNRSRRNYRDERDEKSRYGRHDRKRENLENRNHQGGQTESKYDSAQPVTESDIVNLFFPRTDPFRSHFEQPPRSSFLEQAIMPFRSPFSLPIGRGRMFDLIEPSFFGNGLRKEMEMMFNEDGLDEECKIDEGNDQQGEYSKHLQFTSKVVSIGQDGVRRSRVVNSVTKLGKDGKPITHKKMISCDPSGKTIKEVFADGSERTTKCSYVKDQKDEDC